MTVLTIEQVFEAVREERAHQDRKWGADKQQSLPGYLTILSKEITEARDGWCDNLSGRDAPLAEILQVMTVACRCLEQYGVSGSAISTNDVPEHSEMETPPQKNSGVIDLMLIDGTPFHVDSCIIDSIECDAIGTIVVTQRGARVYVLDSPERIAALREAVR